MTVMEKQGTQAQEIDRYVNRFIVRQEEALNKLNRVLAEIEAKTGKRKDRDEPYAQLAKALHTIEIHRDEHKRITWKGLTDPKELIFAYLRRAEADGIDIEKTTEIQKYPVYRRVFQYVVYHIGPWKEVVREYKEKHVPAVH